MAGDLFVAIPEAVTEDLTPQGVQPEGAPDVSPHAAERLMVKFKDHKDPAFVNTQRPWWRETRNLLESLAKINHPASLELSGDRVITEARMPSVGRVVGIRKTGQGDLAVRFDNFASVLRTEPDSAFVDLLNESWHHEKLVAVTAGAVNARITSVVPAAPMVDSTCLQVNPQPSAAAIVGNLDPTALAMLDQFVLDVAQDSCTLPAPVQGCHAFSYALNYCWVQTEVICQLLRAKNISVAKIWIFPTNQNAGGVLTPATRNRPACEAAWDFHVGALVKSDNHSLRVIDPMLFPCGTVSKDTWVRAMRANHPITKLTDTTVYKKSSVNDPGGNFCSDFFDAELRGSVSELRATVNTADGPPPYATCATTVDPCGQPLP